MEISLCKTLPGTSSFSRRILLDHHRRRDHPPTTVVFSGRRRGPGLAAAAAAAAAVTEEEEWMKAARLETKCGGGGGGLVELLECLEKEAIMGDDEGRDPHDYNRRAQIFDKSARVFQALKEHTAVSDSDTTTVSPDTRELSST